MKPNLLVHHSADPSPEPQLAKIEAAHKKRGFPESSLFYRVGYHFVVEHSGLTLQTRRLTETGAHTDAACEEGHCNDVGIGVCLAGDFTRSDPTPAQCRSLYELWKQLGYPRVVLHSDVKRTACPGDFDFRNELNRQYVADLKRRLGAALGALPRFLGTGRGAMLARLVSRLRRLLGVV